MHSDRQKFIHELREEGARLLEKAEFSHWFGNELGQQQAVLFLAQRLQTMQWDIQTLRQEPLRYFLESICPRITQPIPARFWASYTPPQERWGGWEASDEFRSLDGGLWHLQRDHLITNVQVRWELQSDGLWVEWHSDQPLPPVLELPLYNAQGVARWDLMALGMVLTPRLEGVSTSTEVPLWLGDFGDTSLLAFWQRQQLKSYGCFWRIPLPIEWRSKRHALRLKLEPQKKHPWWTDYGLQEVFHTFSISESVRYVELCGVGANSDCPESVQAYDPNSWMGLLKVCPGSFCGGRQPVLSAISNTVAQWVQWVLGGHHQHGLSLILPEMQSIQCQGVQNGVSKMHLDLSRMDSQYWQAMGQELAALVHGVQMAQWLCGDPQAGAWCWSSGL